MFNSTPDMNKNAVMKSHINLKVFNHHLNSGMDNGLLTIRAPKLLRMIIFLKNNI